MKSLVTKSIYAGLGLLGTGKRSVEMIGRELAKKANLSEKEGEKIARQLSHQSDRAIGTIQKTLNKEVTKVVKALHVATNTAKKRKTTSPAKRKRRTSARSKRTSARG
jgi:polyhydroxyalkanoate synthesis regulator phasin